MSQPLRDFTQVVLSAERDVDYHLVIRDPGGYVAVVALHGGGIEPLTSELAAAIAGPEYDLYDFQGLREKGNETLRVSPLRFDEMRYQSLLRRARTVLSIEGTADVGMTVQVGGGNELLRELLLAALREAGFDARPSETPGIDTAPAYFFNRAEQMGVQLELSQALRAAMVDCPLHAFQWQGEDCRNGRFDTFVATVREVLARYVHTARTDLQANLEHFERITRLIPPGVRSGGNHHHDHGPGRLDNVSSDDDDTPADETSGEE